MATLNCDLMDIGTGEAAGCEEFLAGLGAHIYAVDPDDLLFEPQFKDDGSAAFKAFSFDKANFKTGKKAYKIKIKKQTGHNQATGNEGPKGYQQQLELTIDKDVKNAAQVLRIIKNKGDFYFLIPEANGTSYQVVGDPVYGSALNNNYDSGTTPDSDSGHMVTITSSPCRFSLQTWTPDAESEDTKPSGITKLEGMIADTQNGTGTGGNAGA